MDQQTSTPGQPAFVPTRAVRDMCLDQEDPEDDPERDPQKDVTRLRCAHLWCKKCLAQKVNLAISEEAQFRPRCCSPFSARGIRKYLGRGQLLRDFEAAKYKHSIVDRTLCHDCSEFIAPNSIHNRDAICQNCLLRTCSERKEKWHFGPCKEDAALKDLAFRKGWAKCPPCSYYIDQVGGCNQVVCKCGTAFCYRCKEIMAECKCAADEDYLANLDPRERYYMFLNMHGGRGHGFQRVRVEMPRCMVCGTDFPGWINLCSDCGLTACNGCARAL